MFDVDHGELSRLAGDLTDAAHEAGRDARGVVAKGALNIKNAARENAERSSGTHARLYPATIGYDELAVDGLRISTAIGPEARGQGQLAAILEHGSVNNGGHRDLGRAADAEEPRFERALAALADRLA